MMNEEMEQLERRLNRQPLREIPREWRSEILAAARTAPRASRRWFLPSSIFHLPSPVIRWASLAAVWVVILALNHAARDPAPIVTAKSTPPSPQMLIALRQQQKLLAELIEPPTPREADKPKSFVPRPRSELGRPFVNV